MNRGTRGRLILTGVILIAACSEYKESSYASMAEARRMGAVDRGWLPEILPDEATNVHEVHNVDTNQTWCRFDLTAADANRLRAALSSLTASQISARTVRAPGVEWWPKVLGGVLDPGAIEKAGMKLYMSGPLLFALDAGERHGLMYRDVQ
jgi:hypothetical protein